MPRILIVDDEHMLRATVARVARILGYDTAEAAHGFEAEARLSARPYDAAVVDLRMPEADGFHVLRVAKKLQPLMPVIVLTASPAIEDCVEAMRAGAFDFLSKPFHFEELGAILERAIASHHRAPVEINPALSIVGESQALQGTFECVKKVAREDHAVLVVGEDGTGCEVFARLIHSLGVRAGAPFVDVRLSAISSDVVESELFGLSQVASDGSTQRYAGKFHAARGGTLVLEDIGALPASAQQKLAHALQVSQVTPEGDTRSFPIDVRVIATTVRDLSAEVEKGAFRQDLFDQLSVSPVEIPPLRQRVEDITSLCQHLVKQAAERRGRALRFDDATLRLMAAYSWPGNLSELGRVVAEIVERNSTGVITVAELPAEMLDETPPPDGGEPSSIVDRLKRLVRPKH
jgi:two-component system response regulator HydG